MTAKRTKETKLVLPVSVGSKPHIVTAFERKDKGNSVWIRWWNPVKGRYDKRSLGFTARDAKGVIDQALVEKAHAMALEQYHVLVGINPPVTTKAAPPLTVAAGLDLATTIGTGMWPVPSQRSATFRLLVPRVLAMLPDHITWADLGPSHYEQLWRVPATVAAAAGHNRGREVARTFCILLSQSAAWLARNRKIGEKDGAAPDKWQDKLDDEWNRITKLTYMVNRPRHTQEQLGRIFGGLHLGDPRVALALELAGEGRLGQALRSRRSQLDLTVGPFGAFRVHGSGGKLGTYAFLTE